MKNNKGNYVDNEIKKMIKDQREEKESKKEEDEKTSTNKLPYVIAFLMVISIFLALIIRLLNIF